jgi:hypothetical protein
VARTSATEVKKIVVVRNTVPETAALNSAITTANIVVTRVCVPYGEGYDETDADDIALLAEVEKYLAAHFFCIFKPRREFEQAKSVAQRIQTKVDLGLKLTHYGQQAIFLDVNGGLANKELEDATLKVNEKLEWLGTEYE